MRPARLDISLRNAARPISEAAPESTAPPQSEPEAELEPVAEAAPPPEATPEPEPEPAPASPLARRRGPLAILFAPLRSIAWRARAFLLAPLEARFAPVETGLGRIEARLADLERRTTLVETIVARTLDHRTAMIETIASGLDHRTALTETRAASIEAMTAQGLHQAQQLSTKLEAVTARLERSQRDAVGEMWASVGGRLDEQDLKLRPILAFGDDAWAVRLGDGYILAPRDQPILLSMLADATTGGLEPGTRKTIRAILGPGMKAADIGANIGLLTLAMGRTVGPEGKVWSFEPEDAYRSLLARSLHLNGLAWVELRPEAVGRERGTQTFNVSSIPGHSSLFALPAEEKPRKVKVQVVRLDDVVPEGVALDLVKIDVEGAELEVLAGMERVLAESPELAIVAEYGPSHLARVGVSPSDWFAAFEACGFEPFAVDEGQGRCYAAGPDELKDVESVNIVFVRRGGRAVRRLPR